MGGVITLYIGAIVCALAAFINVAAGYFYSTFFIVFLAAIFVILGTIYLAANLADKQYMIDRRKNMEMDEIDQIIKARFPE
jgi:general stress protein CsbA